MYITYIIYSLLILSKLAVTNSASYENCRMLPGDVLVYHRRIKQGPTRHFSLQLVSFPEILIDLHNPRKTVVISCILCKDLQANATDSECRVLAGGVGCRFVKFGLTCRRKKSYDYDIKIYGKIELKE